MITDVCVEKNTLSVAIILSWGYHRRRHLYSKTFQNKNKKYVPTIMVGCFKKSRGITNNFLHHFKTLEYLPFVNVNQCT